MFINLYRSKRLINLFLVSLLIFFNTFLINASAVNSSSENVQKTQALLIWMEKNLNKNSNFTTADLEQFFAPKFSIHSNGKVIFATPLTYHDYLYKLKTNIQSVNYDTQQFIDAGNYVVVPFIITIKNVNTTRGQLLRVIAIFKFNEQHKVIMWQEVFTQAYDY